MQLLNAQAEAAQQLAALQSGGAPADLVGLAHSQLAELATVQQRLASGTVSAAMLRQEVTTAVAAIGGTMQQARSASASSQAEITLERVRAEARQTINDFTRAFYEDRIFDPPSITTRQSGRHSVICSSPT